MKQLRVITLADDAYSIPLAVMVRSLLEHHDPGRELAVTIIDAGITPENRLKLEASWKSVARTKRAHWEFAPPVFCALKSPTGRKQSLTLSRLTLPQYFADRTGRVLLLCSDTFVLTDLAALHDVDLQGATLAATIDPYISTVAADDGLPHWREAGLPRDTPYFNTGAMVIDLDLWQQERVTERSLEYLNQHLIPEVLSDQEVLNAVLLGRWELLDSRWQTHPRTWQALGVPVPADPWIVHFSGRFRPWQYEAKGPLDRRFYEVLDRTQWQGFRPPATMGAKALALYDSPLRRLLYPLEKRLLAFKKRIASA